MEQKEKEKTEAIALRDRNFEEMRAAAEQQAKEQQQRRQYAKEVQGTLQQQIACFSVPL